MTVEFTPFRAGHLEYLVPQPAQRREHAALLASGAADLLESYVALTAWHQSRCLGMAGCLPVHRYRAVVWMLLSEDAGPHILTISRKIKRVLAQAPWKRIEITVTATFENGQRFARLIGGKLETPEPMKLYGPDGDDQYMYAIVKD